MKLKKFKEMIFSFRSVPKKVDAYFDASTYMI